jgi:hypothetical protein
VEGGSTGAEVLMRADILAILYREAAACGFVGADGDDAVGDIVLEFVKRNVLASFDPARGSLGGFVRHYTRYFLRWLVTKRNRDRMRTWERIEWMQRERP